MKKLMLYIMMILILMLSVSFTFAGVVQDGADTWQIDTFPVVPDEDDYPHLMLLQSYNPNDKEENKFSEPMLSGRVDTMKCAQFITAKKTAARLHLKLLIKEIIKITSNKYIISIGMSVCHVDWYVIYLHDGKYFVLKPVYDKVWEEINPDEREI